MLSFRPYSQSRLGSLRAPQSVFAALLLTLAAIAADQFFAPILYTSSPLWATLACLLLVWRRGEPYSDNQSSDRFRVTFAPGRFVLFFTAHLAIVLIASWFGVPFLTPVARVAVSGWLFAGLKLTVFAPTLLLFPIAVWQNLARTYAHEFAAAMLVLVTFFPTRAMESIWPWYGQILGRSVYAFVRLFVPILGYYPALTPTLAGPDLDLTILYSCSGINGLELFDILFALVVFLDWNRLAKKCAVFAYFVGLAAMLFANALRIAFLFILGNRGFADFVARFHISAGWIFFTGVFLAYLALIYRRILVPQTPIQAKALPLAGVATSAAAE